MRVVALGDVHGNLPALDAVLRHAAAHGASELWNAGDTVGHGPFPDECVRRLRAEDAVSVAGNVDTKVLKVPRKLDQWRESGSKDPAKLEALEWTWRRLSPGSRRWLAALPRERRLKLGRARVLLAHEAPGEPGERLTAATPPDRLAVLARSAGVEIVVCAHAREPFARVAAGVVFVNTGSVGRSAEGDPRASYALLQVSAAGIEVRHFRVHWDGAVLERAAQERGLPAAAGREPPAEPDARLAAVEALARQCAFEEGHTRQVTRLALRLYDLLAPVHGLGAPERFWLECGALLHDIGWCEGPRAHHKTALRLVLESPLLPFDARERRIVGCIARYHRRALPAERHEAYAALGEGDRRAVRVAAGVLRVADALDFTHARLVEDIDCEVSPETLEIRCAVREPLEVEVRRALEKGDLLREVCGRELRVTWYRR